MLLSHVGPVPLGLQKQGLSALFRCWVRRLQTGDRPHISGIYLINIFENQSVAAAPVLFCCATSRNQKLRSDARRGNQLTVCFSKCMSTKNRRIPYGIQRQLTSIPNAIYNGADKASHQSLDVRASCGARCGRCLQHLFHL